MGNHALKSSSTNECGNGTDDDAMAQKTGFQQAKLSVGGDIFTSSLDSQHQTIINNSMVDGWIKVCLN